MKCLRRIRNFIFKCQNFFNKRIKIYKYLYYKNKTKNKNIKIYELTPSININDDTYLDYLKAAVSKKNITNIALSGPYGSGKSSILRVFRKKLSNNLNYKFLNISLATFKDKDEIAELTADEYSAIEKSILQQMFYSVEQYEIPNSRFKRIKFNKNLLKNSLYFSIWIISIIELFSPYTFIYHFFNYFDLTLFFAIIFVIGFMKISKFVFEKTSNIKLSKFIIQNQEVSFDNDSQTSVLNANIDEIIYFFNATKYNIVIIEDLDRFNNLEIFIKLREINTLLNNRKNKEKITFIYAIKDDIFKNKDRTKFFDYIIPVIPFINSSNSFKKLRELLDRENLLNSSNKKDNKKVDEKFIKDISIYINDMRFLINVFNEFIQYTHKLGKDIELDYNSLFAISLYKNYKPDDFAKLHNNEGILYTIFSNKYRQSILDDITLNLKNEIEKLTLKIEEINSVYVKSIEELNALYVYHLISNQKRTMKYIYLNNRYYEVYDLIKNHFELFTKNKSYIHYSDDKDFHNIIDSGITFKELEDFVDNKYSYEIKKISIELKNRNEIDSIKFNRENKKKELSNMSSFSISTLLNKSYIEQNMILNQKLLNQYSFKNNEKIIEFDILQDNLLIYLLSFNYINEDYFKYISYYHPGQETPNDINFVLNVQRNGKALDYDFELTSFEYIFNELNDPINFSKVSSLNYSLIYNLLNENKNDSSKIQYFFESINNFVSLICLDIEKYFEFIDNYLNKYHDNSILKHLITKYSLLWDFIYLNNKFSNEKKSSLFYMIINLDYNDLNDKYNILNKLDQNNQLEQYIINSTIFSEFFNRITDTQFFKRFLISKNLKFKILNDIHHKNENFNFIYENNLYEINFEWIEKILDSHSKKDLISKNYTLIMNSNKNHLISYINNNINIYVKNILLTFEILKEEEKYIINLLDNKELNYEYKKQILNNIKSPIDDISKIKHFPWDYLLKNNKITPNKNNIKNCLENNELKNIFVKNFINLKSTYNNIFDKSNKYDKNEVKDLRLEDIIFDSENINIEVFETFLSSISFKYLNFPENMNFAFLETMIDMKKVETNIENYQFLVNKHLNNLAIRLLENEPNIIIERFEDFNINNETLIQLILSNKFTDKQKIFLLNLSNIEDLLKYDVNNSFLEILYALKIEYFEEFNNNIFNILMVFPLSKKKKIELFLKYKFKNRIEITYSLLKISSLFEPITQLESKAIEFNKNESYLKLFRRLKDINYISSFKEGKNLITIHTYRTEKNIILDI